MTTLNGNGPARAKKYVPPAITVRIVKKRGGNGQGLVRAVATATRGAPASGRKRSTLTEFRGEATGRTSTAASKSARKQISNDPYYNRRP